MRLLHKPRMRADLKCLFHHLPPSRVTAGPPKGGCALPTDATDASSENGSVQTASKAERGDWVSISRATYRGIHAGNCAHGPRGQERRPPRGAIREMQRWLFRGCHDYGAFTVCIKNSARGSWQVFTFFLACHVPREKPHNLAAARVYNKVPPRPGSITRILCFRVDDVGLWR
jgi:hypothetical protein